MSRTEEHVKALWFRGYTSDMIARQLRLPIGMVRAILEELNLG